MSAVEGAATFELRAFSHQAGGHRDDCPMLTAYDNDGCDCADLLLFEVERLRALADAAHQAWFYLLAHPADAKAVAMEQLGLVTLSRDSAGHVTDIEAQTDHDTEADHSG